MVWLLLQVVVVLLVLLEFVGVLPSMGLLKLPLVAFPSQTNTVRAKALQTI